MAGHDRTDLTECEQEVQRAVRAGELVDLRTGTPERDDPVDGDAWGPERSLRAELLYDLLVTSPAPPRAVVLRGARINGGLNLEAVRLPCALLLDSCFCDGPINFDEADAEAIRLTGCRLFDVSADQLETRGDLDLRRSTASIISLRGAHVGGDLVLDAATLTGGSWPLDLTGVSRRPRATSDEDRFAHMALVADGLCVDGDMSCMRGFTADGQVLLLGARVDRQLIFDGANLHNANGIALFADRLNVGQNLFCRKAAVQGKVSLNAAHVSGQLVFDGARLSKGAVDEDEDGKSLNLVEETVPERHEPATEHEDEQHVHQDDPVNEREKNTALDLREAKVPASLWLRFGEPPRGEVRLDRAEVGAVHDDEKTWPSELSLRGLVYGHLESREPVKVERRLLWLQRDPAGYAPQPYEQLIASYRRAGDNQAARRAAIEKQRQRRGKLALRPAKFWSFFLDWTVGYGYRSWLAAVWLGALVILGCMAFDRSYPEHFRAATEGAAGTTDFQPLLYSLDVVLPVVNLGQQDAWIAEGPAQWWVLLTVAGWILATVVLAVVTGLLKKD